MCLTLSSIILNKIVAVPGERDGMGTLEHGPCPVFFSGDCCLCTNAIMAAAGIDHAAKQLPVEQLPVEQPPVEQPPVEQPPVEQRLAEQPLVEQRLAERPPVEQSPVEQPRVEQRPVE